MAKIRSAWEIALERTENIVVDKEKLQKDEAVKNARAYSGSFINDQDIKLDETIEKLNTIEDRDAVKEGIKETILLNLALPQEYIVNDRFERIIAIANYLTTDSQVIELISQIVIFLKQYPEHKDQLLEQLKEQFSPLLQQKAEQLRQQYGETVNLTLENDPEFVKIAKQNLEKLQNQYTETLTNAKNQLMELI